MTQVSDRVEKLSEQAVLIFVLTKYLFNVLTAIKIIFALIR